VAVAVEVELASPKKYLILIIMKSLYLGHEAEQFRANES